MVYGEDGEWVFGVWWASGALPPLEVAAVNSRSRLEGGIKHDSVVVAH